MKKFREGFTMVELLAAIGIIAVLMAHCLMDIGIKLLAERIEGLQAKTLQGLKHLRIDHAYAGHKIVGLGMIRRL
ncbi:MAG TPA: prepilin-type N-terminal cleavage/methylation domain-containing protein [Myxococcales bacterium]|nr:prepilin-type N-terminal cleavage/methylation domain-containing protein [Myxococcales bacterium]